MRWRKVLPGIATLAPVHREQKERLFLKAMFGTILAIGVLLIASAAINIRNAREHVFRMLENRAEVLAFSLERTADMPMFGMMFGAGNIFQEIIENLRQEDIAYFAIVDGEGRVIAHSNPARIGTVDVEALSALRESRTITRTIRDDRGRNVFELTRTLYSGGWGRMRRGMMARDFDPRAIEVGLYTHREEGVLRQAYLQALFITLTLFVLLTIFLYLLRVTRNYLAMVAKNEMMREEVDRSRRLAAIGSLAAGVAHEIRNPLGSIKGFAEFLNEKLEPGDPRRRYFELIISEVRRLEGIVNDLLDYARPKPPQRRPADLRELLDAAADMTIKDNVRVKRNYGKVGESLVDPDQMKQVFLNLLLNALQAGAQTIELGISQGDGEVKIKIGDDGGGIPENDLPRIFDPFFTTKAKGTGLGLALAQQIVENHGGRIRARSRVGQGTVFTIELPIDAPREGTG
ncbi:MAG: two-component system sensor histidine kinase NtrB [bacterium]